MGKNIIKIYVSCHKDYYVPIHPLLYPIQVGAALSPRRLEGMLYDDTGDSISLKTNHTVSLQLSIGYGKTIRPITLAFSITGAIFVLTNVI